MKRSCLVLSVAVLLLASQAKASTDFNGLFDARSAGMGGTGVAFLDSAGAIPTNPALLDLIGKFTLTLDVMGVVAQPEAPYTVYHLDAQGQRYQSYDTQRGSPTFAPLPFLGLAYRLFDRVVIGIAAYPVIGQGTSAEYRPAPDELPNVIATNSASMGLIEAQESVSVRLLDNLSLGLGWRITYMTQSVSTPVPGGPPAGVLIDRASGKVVNADIDVTGIDFKGFQVGILYKPAPYLQLGLTYRNKVVVEGSGTTVTQIGTSPVNLPIQSGFKNPHSFRAGLAMTADKLLLAVDFKYLMYAEAFKELKQVITMNGRENARYQKAYWRDSYAFMLGAEYQAIDMMRLRAGYCLVTSATNETYALAFFAPAGVSHLFSAGLGFKVFDSLKVDVAAAYVVLSTHIDSATQWNAGIGTYASHVGEFSLSATYHL